MTSFIILYCCRESMVDDLALTETEKQSVYETQK